MASGPILKSKSLLVQHIGKRGSGKWTCTLKSMIWCRSLTD